MATDSEDDLLLGEISSFITSDVDSVLLRYPTLWGLPELSHSGFDSTIVELNLSPEDFKEHFKMSRTSFEDLLTKLAGTSKVRCLEKKLLFTLWMLLTQDSYDSVGERFRLSKSSGHMAFTEITDAILSLFDVYVKWPSTSEYTEISQSFKEKSDGRLPGIIGAIDTCHLRIKRPKEDAKQYRCEEQSYSIILQVVCDHRLLFTNVCVGSPGSFSENKVFHDSCLCKDIDNLIPGEYHLVGGLIYPLMRNLVTPFRDTGQLGGARKAFNTLLSKSAVTIAHAVEVLKKRFRKLIYLDTNSPELASKIVCCCIILHNHILMHDEEDIDTSDLVFYEKYLRNWTLGERVQDRHKAGIIKREYLMTLCD